MEKAAAKTKVLVSGNPRDEKTDIGPMISEAEADRAERWIQEAVTAGAMDLAGGNRERQLVKPSDSQELRPACSSKRERRLHLFTVNPYQTFEEALGRINASDYGLQAGVFTRDLGLVEKAFETLEVGGVIVKMTFPPGAWTRCPTEG